jgi:hypothetical protein
VVPNIWPVKSLMSIGELFHVLINDVLKLLWHIIINKLLTSHYSYNAYVQIKFIYHWHQVMMFETWYAQ